MPGVAVRLQCRITRRNKLTKYYAWQLLARLQCKLAFSSGFCDCSVLEGWNRSRSAEFTVSTTSLVITSTNSFAPFPCRPSTKEKKHFQKSPNQPIFSSKSERRRASSKLLRDAVFGGLRIAGDDDDASCAGAIKVTAAASELAAGASDAARRFGLRGFAFSARFSEIAPTLFTFVASASSLGSMLFELLTFCWPAGLGTCFSSDGSCTSVLTPVFPIFPPCWPAGSGLTFSSDGSGTSVLTAVFPVLPPCWPAGSETTFSSDANGTSVSTLAFPISPPTLAFTERSDLTLTLLPFGGVLKVTSSSSESTSISASSVVSSGSVVTVSRKDDATAEVNCVKVQQLPWHERFSNKL